MKNNEITKTIMVKYRENKMNLYEALTNKGGCDTFATMQDIIDSTNLPAGEQLRLDCSCKNGQ